MWLCFNFFVCDSSHRSKKLIKHGYKALKSIKLKMRRYGVIVSQYYFLLINKFGCVFLIKNSGFQLHKELMMSASSITMVFIVEQALFFLSQPQINQQAANTRNPLLLHPDQPVVTEPTCSQHALVGLGVARHGLCATATPASSAHRETSL